MENLKMEMVIDLLGKTSIGENLRRAMDTLEKIQEVAYAYNMDESSENIKRIRVGTIAILSLLSKIVHGKEIRDFTEDDWKEIASDVVSYAVLVDGQRYSVMSFTFYANYVEASLRIFEKKNVPDEKCEAIRSIVNEVRELEIVLANRNITETEYTEQCLWLLLESMIKLISIYLSGVVGNNVGEFVEAVSQFGFEYGRFLLLKRERDLLSQFIEKQGELDAELQERFNAYATKVLEKQEEFENIISHAFDPDIMKRFKTSVNIAKIVGVDDEEILDSVLKIDDFFG